MFFGLLIYKISTMMGMSCFLPLKEGIVKGKTFSWLNKSTPNFFVFISTLSARFFRSDHRNVHFDGLLPNYSVKLSAT